jgi:hypothetical protein
MFYIRAIVLLIVFLSAAIKILREYRGARCFDWGGYWRGPRGLGW